MRSNLRFICSFILVSALYRVPYCFKKGLFPAKSHYCLGNDNICLVYTHVTQWDLHNMKGISTLISRRTCTTSQVLVSCYFFLAQGFPSCMLRLPVKSQLSSGLQPLLKVPLVLESQCARTQDLLDSQQTPLFILCCQDGNISGTLHAPQPAKQGRK